MLHNDAWVELISFLGALEIVNLFGCFDLGLLARLSTPGCIKFLSIRSYDPFLDLKLVRFALHCLPRLDRLNFAFPNKQSDSPPPLALQVFKALPRLQIRELSLNGSGPMHGVDEQGAFTLAECCPSLETLTIPHKNYRDRLLAQQAFLLSRLSTTITSYTGPEVATTIEGPTQLPQSITHLEISMTRNGTLSTGLTSILQSLSTLKSLSVLRIHHAVEATPGARAVPTLPSSPISFPLLTEFFYTDSGSTYGASMPPPMKLIDAPMLHTLTALLGTPNPRIHPLPPTLTRFTFGTSLSGSSLEDELLMNFPPRLKVLRLIGNIAPTNASLDWFSRLPASLEELVAPPAFVDWTRLPPRIERLMCKLINFVTAQKTFRDLSRMESYNYSPPRSAEPKKGFPPELPQTLTEICADDLPLALLPKNIRYVVLESADRTLEDLKTLLKSHPFLTHIKLNAFLTLPNPEEDGSTFFQLSAHPRKVLEKRLPSLLHQANFDIRWSVTNTFVLPSTIETLILDSPVIDETYCSRCQMIGQVTDAILANNLPRLPNLTRINISVYNSGIHASMLPMLPNLEIFKDVNQLRLLAFKDLPRGLKIFDAPLTFSNVTNQPSRFQLGTNLPLASELPSLPQCLLVSELPSTLTELNLGGVLPFSSSSIPEWPTSLQKLSFAVDSSWSDLDALALKERLPELTTLRLFGSLHLTVPLDYGSPMELSTSDTTELGKHNLAPTARISGTDITEMHKAHYASQGIHFRDTIATVQLMSDLAPNFTWLDLTHPTLKLTNSTTTCQLPSSLTSVKLALPTCDVVIDLPSKPPTSLKDSSLLQGLILPPCLTELILTTLFAPQQPNLLESLPRTLKFLHIDSKEPVSTPWECSSAMISMLPQCLETLRMPYMTFDPDDTEILPPSLQLITFAGESWNEADLLSLSERLASAPKSDVFDSIHLEFHRIGEPTYSTKVEKRLSFKDLSRDSPNPPTIRVQCVQAVLTGQQAYEGSNYKFNSLTESSYFALFKLAVHVLHWSELIPFILFKSPETIQSLDLIADLPTPRLQNYLSLPQLPKMRVLQSLALRFDEMHYFNFFELLPPSLTQLSIAGPFEFDYSKIQWLQLPRGLLHLYLNDNPPQRHVIQDNIDIVHLPPKLLTLSLPTMIIPLGSIPFFPSSLLTILSAKDIQSAVHDEWRSRGLPPGGIRVRTRIVFG